MIGLLKEELDGNIMTEFFAVRSKTFSYLMDDGNSDKKVKEQRQIIKFNDYKNCLLNNEIILKSQQRFKSEAHNPYTEEINKIALSSNDDKRLQTFDKIISYPYTTNVGKVCKTELLEYLNIKLLILMIILMKIKKNIMQSGHIFLIIHAEY